MQTEDGHDSMKCRRCRLESLLHGENRDLRSSTFVQSRLHDGAFEKLKLRMDRLP
jgi:hypothetical protein